MNKTEFIAAVAEKANRHRQKRNEADRVAQQEGQIVDDHLAHRGVEGGKKLVLGKHLAFGQQVHQGRLADVGVTHQGHAAESVAVLPLSGLLFVDFFQSFFQQ